jgi:hypothetical protein
MPPNAAQHSQVDSAALLQEVMRHSAGLLAKRESTVMLQASTLPSELQQPAESRLVLQSSAAMPRSAVLQVASKVLASMTYAIAS